MLMMKESLNIQSHDNCANFPPDDGKLKSPDVHLN